MLLMSLACDAIALGSNQVEAEDFQMDWIFTNLNIVTELKHELADYNQIEELFHVILIV
jgi:hypothetical protein